MITTVLILGSMLFLMTDKLIYMYICTHSCSRCVCTFRSISIFKMPSFNSSPSLSALLTYINYDRVSKILQSRLFKWLGWSSLLVILSKLTRTSGGNRDNGGLILIGSWPLSSVLLCASFQSLSRFKLFLNFIYPLVIWQFRV